MGIFVFEPLKPSQVDRYFDNPPLLLPLYPPFLQAVNNILQHGPPWKEGKILKDDSRMGSRIGLSSLKDDLTGSGTQESGNDIEKRRFSTATGTHHNNKLILLNGKMDIPEGFRRLSLTVDINLGDMVDENFHNS